MEKAKLQRVPSRDERQANRSALITDAIAQRAYALYLARGREDGHDVEDWLRAERELLETKNTPSSENTLRLAGKRLSDPLS